MAEPTENLFFDPRGSDYALVREDANGVRTEIILSEANIGFLNRLVPLTLQKILARFSSPGAVEQGVSTDLYVPVMRLRSVPDLHQEVVLLTMFDQYGNKTGYALPLEIAKPLVDTLSKHVSEIEQALKARKVQ